MDSTANVKDKVTDSTSEKAGAHDPEIMDSSTPAKKVGAHKEAIMALKMLFEDFEDQVNGATKMKSLKRAQVQVNQRHLLKECKQLIPWPFFHTSFHINRRRIC